MSTNRKFQVSEYIRGRVTEGATNAGENCRVEPVGEYDGCVANALLQIAYAARALAEGRYEEALTYGRLSEGFQRQGRELRAQRYFLERPGK